MNQIAVTVKHLQIMKFGMPTFESTFFFNSDGTFSVNSVLKAENVKISKWRFGKFIDGTPYLSFVAAGSTFYISNGEHLDIARPFFQKHLESLYEE